MPHAITVYGTSWCGDCHRSRRFLDNHNIPYTWIDVDEDAEGAAKMKNLNHDRWVVPTIVFQDGSILTEPSDRALAEKVGVPL